jgi:hypothetical protein
MTKMLTVMMGLTIDGGTLFRRLPSAGASARTIDEETMSWRIGPAPSVPHLLPFVSAAAGLVSASFQSFSL